MKVGGYMLNKERIRIMTRLAAYEQEEGKEYIPMSQYYRSDYVGLQMLKAFICSTIAFGILLVLYIFYCMEDLQEMLYDMNLESYIFRIVLAYAAFVIFYQVLAWVMYNIRYKKGQKKQKAYYSRLKKVEKLHEREETLVPLDK